jgi:hypothetical protein
MPETSLSGAAPAAQRRKRRRALRSIVGGAMFGSVMIVAGGARGDDAFRCPERPMETAAAERLARTLFEDAVAREPADPEGALARLRCAQRAADRPAIALRIGTIHERMGRLDDAAAAFERYLELAGKDAPDANEMREHVARLREGARRSRTPAAGPPPAREQQAPARGGQSVERPLIPPVISWVVAGLGAATMVTGVVLLVDAAAKDESVHELQGQRWSDDAAGPTHDAAKTEQAFGIAGLVVGAVLGAAGLSSALSGKPSVTVTPAAARGPRGARLAIHF